LRVLPYWPPCGSSPGSVRQGTPSARVRAHGLRVPPYWPPCGPPPESVRQGTPSARLRAHRLCVPPCVRAPPSCVPPPRVPYVAARAALRWPLLRLRACADFVAPTASPCSRARVRVLFRAPPRTFPPCPGQPLFWPRFSEGGGRVEGGRSRLFFIPRQPWKGSPVEFFLPV